MKQILILLVLYYFLIDATHILSIYNIIIKCLSYRELKYAFVNTNIFQNRHLLYNNIDIIRQEALHIYQKQLPSFHEIDELQNRLSNEKWKIFILKWYDDNIPKESERLCPRTTEIIRNIPEIKLAMFSILHPGMKIPPHKGPFAGCLRYHLALKVPQKSEDCFIVLDNQKYSWKEGEDVLFDDTYTHYVENNTNETRIVLFVDVERPLPFPLNYINKMLINNAKFVNYVKNINQKFENSVSTLT